MGNRIRGEGWWLAIWFDCSALSWDLALINCGTNILHGCWLFWQNEIHVYCWRSFIIVAANRIWIDWFALNWDRSLSTVVPTSFVGVHSFDKTRFRFHCIDIFNFKICLLLSPSTSHHCPLSLLPSTISHLWVRIPPSSMRENPHQWGKTLINEGKPSLTTLLISPDLQSSLNFLSCLLPPTLHLILACLC
jgi:hypothetical protein